MMMMLMIMTLYVREDEKKKKGEKNPIKRNAKNMKRNK